MRRYTYECDPGHGWLHVPRSELIRLGIEKKITHYSYQKDDTVFLEEDLDATTFLDAKTAAGEQYEIVQSHVSDTPILGYQHYSHL